MPGGPTWRSASLINVTSAVINIPDLKRSARRITAGADPRWTQGSPGAMDEALVESAGTLPTRIAAGLFLPAARRSRGVPAEARRLGLSPALNRAARGTEPAVEAFANTFGAGGPSGCEVLITTAEETGSCQCHDGQVLGSTTYS